MRLRFRFLAAALMMGSAPALAQSTTVALVNATGEDAGSLEARKTGKGSWSAVPYSARSGASGPASFDTQDCAWDLRVTLASGTVLTYGNVNLCEVQLVTLNRQNGRTWVEYD